MALMGRFSSEGRSDLKPDVGRFAKKGRGAWCALRLAVGLTCHSYAWRGASKRRLNPPQEFVTVFRGLFNGL